MNQAISYPETKFRVTGGDILTGEMKSKEVFTADGSVFLEGPVRGSYVLKWDFDEQLDNFRAPRKQQKALAGIADSPDGLLYIIRSGDSIVGYVSFHNPDPCSRWCKHPKVLELGAIEISPAFRNNKLGIKLLQLAFSNPVMEKNVVITTEYCWHWDLDNTGLDVWSYQRMLAKVFGSVGLNYTQTDDPDICEHVANVLMVRYGKDLSPKEVEQFKSLLFSGDGLDTV